MHHRKPEMIYEFERERLANVGRDDWNDGPGGETESAAAGRGRKRGVVGAAALACIFAGTVMVALSLFGR
ncbi:hypothetical protein [Paenibacillus sp. GYB003]|uniref:hypothetical protein n=1 Tax=Paenibacillus sp. GYB003 TaxID=2994392 RepID=UPI002F965DB0